MGNCLKNSNIYFIFEIYNFFFLYLFHVCNCNIIILYLYFFYININLLYFILQQRNFEFLAEIQVSKRMVQGTFIFVPLCLINVSLILPFSFEIYSLVFYLILQDLVTCMCKTFNETLKISIPIKYNYATRIYYGYK